MVRQRLRATVEEPCVSLNLLACNSYPTLAGRACLHVIRIRRLQVGLGCM